MPKVGREHIYWALETSPAKSVHPLRLMLRTREESASASRSLHNWLSYRAGRPDDAYHSEVGRRFIIAMVARTWSPVASRLHDRLGRPAR